MINNLRSKINWKAVLILGLIIGAFNYDADQKYPIAAAFGYGTGVTIVALPYALIVGKGKKDFQLN